MIQVNVSVLELLLLVIQVGVIAYTLWLGSKARQARKDAEDQGQVLKAITKNQDPREMMKVVVRDIREQLFNDAEVLSSVENDLRFLHDELYKRVEHPRHCPTCSATFAHVERLRELVKNVQVQAEDQ